MNQDTAWDEDKEVLALRSAQTPDPSLGARRANVQRKVSQRC